MRRVNPKSLTTGLPIRGTFILILLQRSFAAWPAWVWGAAWTLLAFVWFVAVHDLWKASDELITEAEWERVFPSKGGR